ncbi:MAG: preprotein translocase subunit Sec61beta [Thermoprotei archaeon]|nr:MAG: preprotein translocase subunit Sec61beta [Thermoprotei archaeon]
MPKERKKKARREQGPMPLAGAGLVRFFEEEVRGIQIPPEAVVGVAFGLTVMVLIAHVLLGFP